MEILKTGKPLVACDEDLGKALSVADKLFRNGQPELASRWYQAVVDYRRNAFALARLAHIDRFQGRFSSAKGSLQQALDLEPDNPELMANLASLLVLTGYHEEGIALARKAVARAKGHPGVVSSYLTTLHYASPLDPGFLYEEHVRWGAQLAGQNQPARRFYHDPDPERVLRVGYVSADFRMHSVAYNMEAFFSARDRSRFEAIGYHCSPLSDPFTRHLAGLCTQFREVEAMSDQELADQIQADAIDILVFVGGHTMDNRLGVAAYRPAPIQVDYGSINTIGSPHIDYRLTDAILDPPDSQSLYLETLVHLPEGLICYKAPTDAPAVAPLPARQNGYVTFGSFNGSQKTGREVVGLWSEVLRAVPGSRFLLKFAGGDDAAVAQRYRAWFEACGVKAERVEIRGWVTPREHLEYYHRVDIALDTFPYHGCLTTLEGLWMGVPVISLRGDCYVSRVSDTILSRLDMAFFVATQREEVVRKAQALAGNTEALARIRTTLRQRMQASVLSDAKRFAGQVERAYREMWQAWVRSVGGEETVGSDQTVVEVR